jgi:hypothetical protein
MPADIIHPVLGRLVWNGKLDSWESKIDLRPGCPIDVSLITLMDAEPTHNIDQLIQRGVDMLEWARNTESACRQRIADELLEDYNDTWAPEDAPALMSREEFMRRITPNSLVLDIGGSGYFYWGDDGLFLDHWIMVRFGKDWTITEVGLAG